MDQSKISVRLDMDDVLSELCMHWMNVHEEKTGERLRTTTWNVHELSEFGEEVYNHFTSEDFYYNVPMKDGADKTIRFLENNSFFFNYNIVSSCNQKDDREYQYIREQKIKWIYDNLQVNAVGKFHLVRNGKKEYPADILVDDNLDNLIDHGEGLKILFTATHNINLNVFNIGKKYGEALIRVDNHKDLQSVLKDIMVEQSVNKYIKNSSDLFYLH